MTARQLVFLALLALLLAPTLWTALGHDPERLELGHGDHVPHHRVGVAPFDHVPSVDPGDMRVKAQSVGRPRAASVAATGAIPDLIRAVFSQFGPDVAEQAVRVFGCETGGTYDPAARNGNHVGLAQISARWHRERIARLGYTIDQLTDPLVNLHVAADLYAEQQWRPWTCKP